MARLGRILWKGGEVGCRRLVQQCVAHMTDLESTILQRTAHDDLAVAVRAIDLAAVGAVKLVERERKLGTSLHTFETCA